MQIPPGLTDEQVIESRLMSGTNELRSKEENSLVSAIRETVTEPMFLLLVAAGIIYFILGETSEGIFMIAAIVLVSAISIYQDSRSRNALEALKALNKPTARVVRNGVEKEVPGADIVKGDVMIVEEGGQVPADGRVLRANDLSVNESILTGEAFAVRKSEGDLLFQGTAVISGMAWCEVTAVGSQTELGKIGRSLEEIRVEKSPLQKQISSFVTKMAIVGAGVFLLVWGINFYHSGNVLESLLKGLTLAMSILPEEIPVAFTTFMALGAWRLMQMGIIVKQTQTVETLGSASVICTDKTGTITENRMELAALYAHGSGQVYNDGNWGPAAAQSVLSTAMWASETQPFDPMEIALHAAYTATAPADERPAFHMVHEYPLGGKPPMMTHVFANAAGQRIIAAKGAPEAILACCHLPEQEAAAVRAQVNALAGKGYRVLGVARSTLEGTAYPAEQQALPFSFTGLVAFYDPPKHNIHEVFNSFYKAGIAVKIITGDNTPTTVSIAQQAGFKGGSQALTGDEIAGMKEAALGSAVKEVNIFTRMFPTAKLRIINALKADRQIVAMTGDGVNDGPALKAAHIGIAMGHKGTEIAKRAASLVLTDDDLSKMVDAVAMGRKIYSNLKKAIQYILSIHIPIILTVTLPLLLGWVYPNIFTPVHVIFLELIMGPTCSIVYENEPIEKNTMLQPPRPATLTFLNWRELNTSILQGLMITLGTLGIYQYAVYNGYPEDLTRTLVFITLMSANVILTLVNRSFYYSMLYTVRYNNRLLRFVLLLSVLLTVAIVYVPPFAAFFKFHPPMFRPLMLAIGAGILSVVWMEGWKWIKRNRGRTIPPNSSPVL
ncbi:haloacid dehalogenase [Chitinophaga alhagiae]|uniref:Haloacid dehalogenase n=1 Tax=Chitinophaga alhagiae TaxID=2203219 RepID=A0ABM6WB83_9BACT|nr:cation-translocating P-type ATPase [Chitinophaga alhagiae]AWO01114.1 haloacid dehalogenase [Chitinophaga alhagiae]